MSALQAFEALISVTYPAILADHYLQKMSAIDPENPEFFDKMIDGQWQMFRAGWMAAQAS